MSLDNTKEQTYELWIPKGKTGFLKIIIDGPTPQGQSRSVKVTDKKKHKSAIDDYIPSDDLMPSNKLPPIWDFFDIATRLRSVDTPSDFTNGFREVDAIDSPSTDPAKTLEYVEILFDAEGVFSDILQGEGVPATGEFDVYSIGSNHAQVDIVDESKLAEWDNVCLGLAAGDTLDPFGTTKLEADGARDIPNCMPIWYGKDDQPDDPDTYLLSSGFQSDDFDVELYKSTTVNRYPNSKVREIVSDLGHWFRSSITQSAFFQSIWDSMTIVHNLFWQSTLNKDGDYEDERKDHEIWNPLSLAQNGTDISKRGRMNMKESDSGSGFDLRLNSRLIYEPFDTGDTINYKVTRQPSFDADEVNFKTSKKSAMKFYLKPQWLGFFREEYYSNTRHIQYETIRSLTGPTPPPVIWANHQLGLQGEYSGTSDDPFQPWNYFGIEFGPIPYYQSGYNPDGPVYDRLDFTMNGLDGSWTLTSNSVAGTGIVSLSGTARYVPNPGAPGFWYVDVPPDPPFEFTLGTFLQIGAYSVRIQWREGSSFDDPRVFSNDSISGSIHTGAADGFILPSPWFPVIDSIGISSEIFRGCHIGRFPVFPRILGTNNEWDGPIFNDEEFPTTYDDGTIKIYVPDIAKNMSGRIVSWDFGNFVQSRQFYARHTSRDAKEILKRIYTLTYNTPPPVGSQVVTPHTIGSLPWKDIQNKGEGINTWNPIADSYAGDVAALLSALPTIRNVTIGTPSSGYLESSTIYVVPLDARVGTLCGVIVKGTTKYYIWRKTAETRGGFDYDRNQAIAFYTGSLD